MGCCPGVKACTVMVAIAIIVETLIIASLNMVSLLACNCHLVPPLHLNSDLIEDVWSWFYYDKEADYCSRNLPDEYTEPEWISPVPENFKNSSIYNVVNQHANYSYQIMYYILNCLWFFSSFLLLYAHTKGKYLMFLPFICISVASFGLDTVIGSFYIVLMIDSEPSWKEGQAIFGMTFIYFRGYLVYVMNFVFTMIVCLNFFNGHQESRKVNQLQKEEQGPAVTTPPNIQHDIVVPQMSPYQGSYKPEPQPTSQFTELEMETNLVMKSQEFNKPERPVAPSKYRPFSYTNPAYRPTDPYDVEGMRTNAIDTKEVLASHQFPQNSETKKETFSEELSDDSSTPSELI